MYRILLLQQNLHWTAQNLRLGRRLHIATLTRSNN